MIPSTIVATYLTIGFKMAYSYKVKICSFLNIKNILVHIFGEIGQSTTKQVKVIHFKLTGIYILDVRRVSILPDIVSRNFFECENGPL